jgi:hypothetical protein
MNKVVATSVHLAFLMAWQSSQLIQSSVPNRGLGKSSMCDSVGDRCDMGVVDEVGWSIFRPYIYHFKLQSKFLMDNHMSYNLFLEASRAQP